MATVKQNNSVVESQVVSANEKLDDGSAFDGISLAVEENIEIIDPEQFAAGEEFESLMDEWSIPEELQHLTDWGKVAELLQQEAGSQAEESLIVEPDPRENSSVRDIPESIRDLTDWDRLQELLNGDEPSAMPEILTPEQELDRIELPGRDEITRLPVEEMDAVYRQAREVVVSVLDEIREQLPHLGFSGRGEKDLEKILDEKKGTYPSFGVGDGDAIMVWGIEKVLELEPETIIDSLEEMAWRSIAYMEIGNDIRRRLDPNPGGIIVVTPNLELDPSPNRRGHWLRPDLERDNPVGEDTISLMPDEFDRTVRGVISYERLKEYIEMVNQIDSRMSEVGPEAEGKIPGETPEERQQRIDEYNELYPRRDIVRKITSLRAVADALKLLVDTPRD